MDWEKLLCSERLGDKSYEAKPNRSIFVQDHDRIVFSAPFRRLANKTQVQPLYEHDHVHHRLIHSVEVSSVGRSLAMRIGSWLEQEKHIPIGDANSLANIVQAACVAHDIGNPPFGHSGEAAMGDWFAEKFDSPKGVMAEIEAQDRTEFTKFEGNAQGFRIVTRLEMYRNDGGMRLSKATLGTFTKYPVTSATRESVIPSGSPSYVGLKKFGIFRSELDLFKQAADALGLPEEVTPAGSWWRRHPLVHIVEAADDICYNIVDLEDAFTTGELPFDTVKSLLHEASNNSNRNVDGLSQAEHIALLRALSIGAAIDSCVEAFKTNYAAIMSGAFSQSLIEAGPMAPVFEKMKTLSRDQVFTGRRKTELEVSGRRVIGNVMSGLLPVIDELGKARWDQQLLSDHNRQLVRALDLDLRNVGNAEQALHALADFTSGMTDRYAVRIAKMLSGI
ncbi:deoxyguanosinetriphosphate triphosphohydrolase [Devosia epidermidihirudinis]|uniref:Deoxyguanosinetriphosphate triphosphohydrolase n=1 Tax=Devosia epidermidihirudinis TaxID=1293439 RepID=A0A0F5QDG1_9HYPH|nr:dNTP triphosphohydrolase [Devosia epidermidihirudinis]KKC38756.1 deoxyguanosinetriphosphate triphosphohydrolase [Devosia epidermidihirudinis]